ncbi:hypothetical protein NQ665_01825 [Acinetobacter baumannii]|nr:hypothetical protein [Acinetobacter baumannii]
MSESNNEKVTELKAVYKLAIDTRNFEIHQLINRNNFFMLFQGVLLAAVFNNQASKPFVEFVICFAGIFISWHQIGVAAGAKYWQEWWELKASEIEDELKNAMKAENFISLFNLDHEGSHQEQRNKVIAKIEKHSGWLNSFINFLILRKYSVSRVPIRSGLVLMATWIILFLNTLDWSFIFTTIDLSQLIDGHFFEKTPSERN